MPLIDLKTNLKSLKFTGAAPYVTKDINNPPVYGALSNEITSRVDDVSRLVKLLADTPGLKFIANQALLQSSDPSNASNRESAIGQIAGTTASILKNTARTIGTVLAQAGVNGTGTHFIQPSPEYYYTAGSAAQTASVSTVVTPKGILPSLLQRLPSDLDTSTDRKVGRTDKSNSVKENGYVLIRKTPFKSSHPQATDLPTESLDDKYGFTKHRSNGKSFQNMDEVGKLDIYNIETGDALADLIENDLDTADIRNLKKDMVPIVFGKYPKSDYKLFRGFIGNITDNFQANWNAQKYVGRMENFFIYTGFNRAINFNLTVPIFTESEQPTVYNKVNALVSHTAPEYKDGTGIPSGIITHLRIGDYLDSPGVLNSVGITISNDIPWSIGPGVTPMLLPQVLQVSVQFTPIHTKTPQYHNTALSTTESKLPYIGNTQKV
jgi:hypothetical protein